MLESQLGPPTFSVLHPLHIHKLFNDQLVQKTSAHACALFSIFFDRLVFKSLQLRQKQMTGLGHTPKWEQQQQKLSPACTWVKVHNLVDYWFAPLHSPHLVGPENKGFNAPVSSNSFELTSHNTGSHLLIPSNDMSSRCARNFITLNLPPLFILPLYDRFVAIP